jgi:hypothetical protein
MLQVVSLPTADERKRMEAAGRAVIEQPYGEKVRAIEEGVWQMAWGWLCARTWLPCVCSAPLTQPTTPVLTPQTTTTV